MELYLVRHGETESNKEKRYRGWSESPLSEEGIRQAEKAAYFLAGLKIESLYCSDLKRALNTARVIGAASGLIPEVNPLLREINFGRWEGLTYDEIEAGWGDAIRNWLDDPFSVAAPEGESLGDVCSRMLAFLEELAGKSEEGQRIAVVSHGGSIRALLFRALKLGSGGYWDIKVDNGSVSLIRKEGAILKVTYYNRVHHLGVDELKEGFSDDN
jgi:alpha-ribazole phosphatase